jgi:hypothetical protein
MMQTMSIINYGLPQQYISPWYRATKWCSENWTMSEARESIESLASWRLRCGCHLGCGQMTVSPMGNHLAICHSQSSIQQTLDDEELPNYLRNEFVILSTAYSQTMVRLVTGFNAAVTPWLLVALREFPKSYYLADMRKRYAAGS